MFFIRIDDRFIHGQVGVAWISQISPSEIVLLNDKLADDRLASMMQKMSVATSKVTIKNMEDGITYLKGKKTETLKSLFVIVANPQDALKMLDAGMDIKNINIGHSAHKSDSVEVYTYLFVGKEELEAYQKLEQRGVDLDFRLIPSHRKVNLNFAKIKI